MASLGPEPIFNVGFFTVTNTVLNTLLVDAVIIGSALYLSKTIKKIPGKFQNFVEYIIESFYGLTESIAEKKASFIFPFFMTFFIFILFLNWSGLIPGVGSIGIFHHTDHGEELIPLFRPASSDLNATLGLAIISAVATHFFSIQTLGIKEYLGRFFSFNPIYLFVGMLEIVSEVVKVISLSFRLFGNIFAGEVVLMTVAGMFAFLFPLPFLMLEVIVGLVQALVFSMLTMAFMAILATSHHEEVKAHGV